MRAIKALGAATVLVFLATAIAGAASASAVALCKEKGAGACPKEQTYPAKTIVSGTLEGTVKFSTKEGEEELSGECKKSEWKSETTAESGEKTVPGVLNSHTFTECTSNLGACTVQVLNTPWAENFDNMGNVAWSNLANGAPAIRVTCLFGLFHCRYSVNSLIGTMMFGNPAIYNVNQNMALQADPPGGNSFGCGAVYTYVASFNVLPAPMFVR